MSDKSQTTGGGVGIAGLFGVAFVVLKLCHVIDWSWWWVLSPFWIPIPVVIVVLGIIAICYLFSSKK